MEFIYWLIIVLILVLTGLLSFLLSQKREKEQVTASLDMSLFLVAMPKYGPGKKDAGDQEEKSLIGHMEQIFTNFLYLQKPSFWKEPFFPPPRIALEIASQTGGKDISFYVSVPRNLESAFEKYVQGIYPRALVEKVPQDYTIFEPAGKTAGSFLKLRESFLFPINTYKNLEKDPLAAITNALSKISADEGASFQIIIKPSSQNLKGIGEKAIAGIKEGEKPKKAIAEASRSPAASLLAEIFNIFSSSRQKTDQTGYRDAVKKQFEIDNEVVKSIQEKIQKPIFETNIRLLSSAQSLDRAEEILNHLEGAFSQFSLFVSNGFVSRKMKGRHLKKFIYDFSFRNFQPHQAVILNIEELTSLYHFPSYFIETPYIKSVKSGSSAPPAELPDQGTNLMGEVTYRGEKKDVYFAEREDRRRHFYIVGQTGTGKSSLLREMIRQDIERGEGVGLIDPHGDLVEHTLANIPKERIKDVVLFEPFDIERPVGLNMLEYKTPSQKDFAVQEMITIFHTLFPPEIIGPMFEHYMRNAMLAIMSDKESPGTLVEIPRMFTDQRFMEERLEKVKDHIVKNFWLKEWKQTTGATKSDMLGYVVSKIGRFIENEMMRNIIGQSRSGFDLSSVMGEGKIFLANLSKGLTGEVNASLLGLILVSKMQMAAMRSAELPESQRRDFYLYVDEFQNFTTNSITTILSEARKYRLNLILAHQYLPQLTEDIRNAVLGNVGSMGSFRVGADDAEFLEKQFEPQFSRFDLINLDNFYVICKMMIKGKLSEPFSFQTIIPKKGDVEQISDVKRQSKERYGRLKQEVEEEILERSRLGSDEQ